MLRVMQCGRMASVILCSSVSARPDEAKDKAVAFVEKLGDGHPRRERTRYAARFS